jgi:hypothetical protein
MGTLFRSFYFIAVASICWQCFVCLSQTEKRNVRTAFTKQFDERGLRGVRETVVMTLIDSSSWTQQKNTASPMEEFRVTDNQNGARANITGDNR